MISSKAAKRYASAFFGFSKDNGKLKEALNDMELLKNTLELSRELVVFLGSPVVKKDIKFNVLSELFKSRVKTESWKFIELVSEKDRLNLLPGITRAFIDIYQEDAGILEAEATFAFEPETSQIDALNAAVSKETGKTLKLTTRTQPDIIGGVIVRVKDTVYDGSVKNKLEQLESLFSKAAN